MKTCKGKKIKADVKDENPMVQWIAEQRIAQRSSDKVSPEPIAVHPMFCNAYCNGFTLGVESVVKKYGIKLDNEDSWIIKNEI